MYRLCPKMVQITVLSLSRSLVTPRDRCVIMNKVVNESLRKMCHYQQNVPQHYYLLDTLVNMSINQTAVTLRHIAKRLRQSHRLKCRAKPR